MMDMKSTVVADDGAQPLHLRYRPSTFEEVLGHAAPVFSLQKLIKRKASQTFLFYGPSGCGKTTLARITARELGVLDKDVMELDAATHTGIDAMRVVQDSLLYKPFGKGKIKAILLDECHRLSQQAWDSLLKSIEEPPPHVVWLFCTTALEKVPHTIRTRCSSIGLKTLSVAEIDELIETVCQEEKIKLPQGVATMVRNEAHGSARQALVNLSLVRELPDKAQAAETLRALVENNPLNMLCQFMLKGKASWPKVMEIVKGMALSEQPEGIRIGVCHYMAKVARDAKSDDLAMQALQIMEEFAVPYNTSEKDAPLLRSIGRVVFSG